MPKRYVLLVAEGEISDADRRDFALLFEGRYGKVTVIALESNPRALIVKTTDSVARLLRESSVEMHVGKVGLATVLTSGSIGKLKSRASGSEMARDDEVSK